MKTHLLSCWQLGTLATSRCCSLTSDLVWTIIKYAQVPLLAVMMSCCPSRKPIMSRGVGVARAARPDGSLLLVLVAQHYLWLCRCCLSSSWPRWTHSQGIIWWTRTRLFRRFPPYNPPTCRRKQNLSRIHPAACLVAPSRRCFPTNDLQTQHYFVFSGTPIAIQNSRKTRSMSNQCNIKSMHHHLIGYTDFFGFCLTTRAMRLPSEEREAPPLSALRPLGLSRVSLAL